MHNRYFRSWDGKTDTPSGRYYAAVTVAKDAYRDAVQAGASREECERLRLAVSTVSDCANADRQREDATPSLGVIAPDALDGFLDAISDQYPRGMDGR